jgi:hypothetical protein
MNTSTCFHRSAFVEFTLFLRCWSQSAEKGYHVRTKPIFPSRVCIRLFGPTSSCSTSPRPTMCFYSLHLAVSLPRSFRYQHLTAVIPPVHSYGLLPLLVRLTFVNRFKGETPLMNGHRCEIQSRTQCAILGWCVVTPLSVCCRCALHVYTHRVMLRRIAKFVASLSENTRALPPIS